MLAIVIILGILAASVALTLYLMERAKTKARKQRKKPLGPQPDSDSLTSKEEKK